MSGMYFAEDLTVSGDSLEELGVDVGPGFDGRELFVSITQTNIL